MTTNGWYYMAKDGTLSFHTLENYTMAGPGRPHKDGTPAQSREEKEAQAQEPVAARPVGLEFDEDDIIIRIPDGSRYEDVVIFLERVRNAFNGA